jgi:hypothetical protein
MYLLTTAETLAVSGASDVEHTDSTCIERIYEYEELIADLRQDQYLKDCVRATYEDGYPPTYRLAAFRNKKYSLQREAGAAQACMNDAESCKVVLEYMC